MRGARKPLPIHPLASLYPSIHPPTILFHVIAQARDRCYRTRGYDSSSLTDSKLIGQTGHPPLVVCIHSQLLATQKETKKGGR